MPESFAQEIGLLRTLAANLEQRPLPFERITQEYLRKEGLGRVRQHANGITSLRMPGHHAFSDLSDCILDRLPALDRGLTYADVQTELLAFIDSYAGREPASVGSKEVETLLAHFQTWFAGKASSWRIFVPCLLARTPAPRFAVGPVTFEFIDNVVTSDFYPRDGTAGLDRRGFDDLLGWMREHDADWLARISVEGCEQHRAEEIGELAVDLAIVALQLSAPSLGTNTMGRLDTRRGTSEKRTVAETDGFYNTGWSSKLPGLSIGHGTLEAILQKAAPVFTAVGNIVQSFTSGSFRLPALERAWCDAAYWLHQALVESLDTIATAKLETALEVLVGSESTKGSERRILQIVTAFFGLEADEPILQGSRLTAQQFARRIVRDRSRILHGTWSTLRARGFDRPGMEGFVITTIRMAAVELEAYAQSKNPADNVDDFLRWVREKERLRKPK
ncbi:hypothetical protein [Bradyrhizobium elkanii]|uniref:hypothetical protein n=1 Tax=Bradyrhizobium elkanii TaxID=29448 RepID=UPI0021699CF7|nr:hypothetical protein [Bradyrhizobium elkanii]MCS3519271.1 hypothetical protein [Bradyrhizobium elkanii]MCS4066928.1 hypothetical protein [Bradyrhizobium elkanii]MCS4082463.1 hypothetical protein [Bradyrhizobium elkanii]MCW2127919.1 hypothetical protein [Bradyrhizobium elkanii]MCW2174662.1 hypothetical protein [Bradyrhizobium elkanii]